MAGFSKSEKWQWIPFEGTFSDKAYHGGAQIILRLEPVASALEESTIEWNMLFQTYFCQMKLYIVG